MRINILTLNGYKNYGNRLQLFALSETVKGLDNNFELKNYWPKGKKQLIKELAQSLIPTGKKSAKEKKMRIFSKRYTPKCTRSAKCDYSIVGSDQVWNPEYIKGRSFLLDVPGDSKKVSYAASMGFSILTNEQKKRFEKSLKTYSAISVREQSANEILQPLTDKKITTVLDPTLLVEKAKYETLERRPKDINENDKFIVCYILGNRDYDETVNNFAKKRNCKVVFFSDKKDSDYGIEEFLYLIHHAQLICTDSFHACVFSFIFERPFVAFKRSGASDYMYTRLQNLIDTFQLKNREFNGKEITKENLKVDYTEAKKILKKEQKKSLDFLKKALDIKE